MDREKLDKELNFLSDACGKATERYVLAYQLIANLLAVIVLAVVGTIALTLLGKGTFAKIVGFIIGVIALGGAGIILASGAAAVHRRMFSPPSSSYESPWQPLLQFLRRNCCALSGGYGIFFAAFVAIVCILLIPAALARVPVVGPVLFAVLLIPMTLIAAAGVLSLLVGTFVVPADVALREKDLKSTTITVFGNTFRQLLNCLRCLGGAYVAAFLVALPIFALLGASVFCVKGIAFAVIGVVITESGALVVASFFMSVLVAGAATLPLALFNVIVGLKYREILASKGEETAGDVEP